jgi:disulfide bond formation protein DsbB
MAAMRALIAFTLRTWPALAFLTALAMLLIAHGFETFGHLPPCELCLRQREAYWIALPVTAGALLVDRSERARALVPWLGAAMALAFAYGLGWATYHAGVEWRLWPGPSACSGAGAKASTAALAALLQGQKVSAPHCDVAPWRFLWLSMAGWNALISAKLMVWSAVWAAWSARR